MKKYLLYLYVLMSNIMFMLPCNGTFVSAHQQKINEPSKDDTIPLVLAVENGNLNLVEELLKAGTNQEVTNKTHVAHLLQNILIKNRIETLDRKIEKSTQPKG